MILFKFFFPVILFILSGAVFSQVTVSYTPGHSTVVPGAITETDIGHTTCVARKEAGNPIIFIIRTNRPDLFFEEKTFGLLRGCLLRSKTILEKKKNTEGLSFHESISPPIQYYGEISIIACKEWRSKMNLPLMYEFVFPWMSNKEISKGPLLSDLVLRACLSKVERVASHDVGPTYKGPLDNS